MRLNDFVAKSIYNYPSIYKDVDYSRSEMKVLDHVFFTCGNGMELAMTEDPAQGGYYVTPKMRKRKYGEWDRLLDAPYGQEVFKPLPKGFFDHPVFYISSDQRIETSSYKGRWNDKNNLYIVIKGLKGKPDEDSLDRFFGGPRLMECESRHEFSPYPFSEEYSAFGDLFNGGFLQEDWMDGLRRLCVRALEYYKTPAQHAKDSYHPDQSSRISIPHFKETSKRGPKAVRELRKTWGWPDGDTVPSDGEIYEQARETFGKFLEKQVRRLESFLNDGTVTVRGVTRKVV